MESKEITSRAALGVGDLVRPPWRSWNPDRIGPIVKIEDNVDGEPMITVLWDGKLLEFRAWKLRKVQ